MAALGFGGMGPNNLCNFAAVFSGASVGLLEGTARMGDAACSTTGGLMGALLGRATALGLGFTGGGALVAVGTVLGKAFPCPPNIFFNDVIYSSMLAICLPIAKHTPPSVPSFPTPPLLRG